MTGGAHVLARRGALAEVKLGLAGAVRGRALAQARDLGPSHRLAGVEDRERDGRGVLVAECPGARLQLQSGQDLRLEQLDRAFRPDLDLGVDENVLAARAVLRLEVGDARSV